jgi:serine/threonine-protein kinase
MAGGSSARRYRFGSFELDAGRGVVLSDGERVALVPKAVDLLAALVAREGRLATKRELMEEVWPGVVVEEGNLSKVVFALRQKLGEAAIETVPKRGYRFALDVTVVDDAAGASLAAAERAIAVLPFTDLSADQSQRHLCEGIAEEILSTLARLPGLAVVARPSAFRLAGQGLDAREIGRRLGVSALVDGSVRREGGRLRISATLVDATTGFQRWSHSFDGQAGELLELEREIAVAVAEQVGSPVASVAAARRMPEFEVYELYLQGRYLWNQRPGDVVWRSLECFEKAVARDPGFALAWTGLADVYATLGSWEAGVLPHSEAQRNARRCAERALAIDPGLAEARTTLAYTAMHYDRDLDGAERGFREALAIDGGHAAAHHWLSHCLAAGGRFDASLAESRRALLHDPMNLVLNVHLSWHWHMARAPDKGLEQAERVVKMEPQFHWGHYFVAWAAEALGEADRAVAAAREALRCAQGDAVMLAGLGRAAAVAGDRAEALVVLRELERRGSAHDLFAYEAALIHLALGGTSDALSSLERASGARSGWMPYLSVDPRMDPLRGEPRFVALAATASPADRPARPRR